jgi:hypothetical protein
VIQKHAVARHQPTDRSSRSIGTSLILTGRTLFFRSDRRLAVIRISLKDEAIKALHLVAFQYGASGVNQRADPGPSGKLSR